MLIGGTLAALGAAATRTLALRSGDRRMTSISLYLSMFTFLFISLALLLLTSYFLTSDFSYAYVWSYSSTDLDTAYKLSGVWAGASGSFLLWTWLMALVLIVEVILEPRRRYLSRKFHSVFQIVISTTVFLFLLILLAMNIFKSTDAWGLQYFPDGYGMKLVLQTPEMIIHPPVVFVGYAFCVAAFAACAAYFITSDKNWSTVSLPWARLSWLFLTLGIGIGAIWAYYVLGWGGYWAWDPVETASLLPWLIVTAFLHTQIRHVRKGEYGVVSPMLGMLSFVAVIFATFATRAGGIWTSSVHAFGSAEGVSAGARLSYILQNDNTVLGIFTLMLMFLVLSVFLAYSKYRSTASPKEPPEPEKITEYISDKNNMLLTVVLLLATSAIMLMLLFKNVNVSQSANYVEFNQKMSLFFVAIMVTMTICMIWKYLGKEIAFWLGSSIMLLSVVLGVGAALTDSMDGLVAFSLPSYVVAVGASAVKLVKSGVSGSIRTTLQNLSPHIIHLAVALVLMSFVVSTNLQQFPVSPGQVATPAGLVVSVGDELSVGDYSIRLISVSARSELSYSGGTTVTEVREAVLDIVKSGDTVKQGVTLIDKYGPSSRGGLEVVDIGVFVYKSLSRDLYINFQWRDNSSALIEAKTIPLMNTLWIGFGLLVVGLAVRTAVWRQEPKETKPPEDQKQVPEKGKVAPSAKDKEYYESKVEEELRKFKQMKGK
jgi:cytochrome c-type biogenesis protein CcmF